MSKLPKSEGYHTGKNTLPRSMRNPDRNDTHKSAFDNGATANRVGAGRPVVNKTKQYVRGG